MSEPTSALTFRDLIIEVARFLGYAYYGEDGDGPVDVPVDEHDLAEAKRHVNDGIRMFISDEPPTGWRWTQPVASVTLWPAISTGSGTTVSGGAYSSSLDETLLTASADAFFPSMEQKEITITGVGAFEIKKYLTATTVKVTGDASSASAATFSIDVDAAYTLPQSFGGLYAGQITFAQGTNQGAPISWTDEAIIRGLRENTTVETGDPRMAAVRLRPDRRRWELVVYPEPDEQVTVEFKFDLHFDKLANLDDKPPIPFTHDETVRAACLAAAERDDNDEASVRWDYYQNRALPQSYARDARSGPRRLGIMTNPDFPRVTPRNFREFQQRPTVTVS